MYFLSLTSFTVCHPYHDYRLRFWFYWFGFNSIRVVHFSKCFFSLDFVTFLSIAICWIPFNIILFFSCYYCLQRNSTFDSWFGWYELGCCFYMGGYKIFKFIIWSISFRCFVKNIKLVSYSYRLMISNIRIGEWGPVILRSFNWVLDSGEF